MGEGGVVWRTQNSNFPYSQTVISFCGSSVSLTESSRHLIFDLLLSTSITITTVVLRGLILGWNKEGWTGWHAFIGNSKVWNACYLSWKTQEAYQTIVLLTRLKSLLNLFSRQFIPLFLPGLTLKAFLELDLRFVCLKYVVRMYRIFHFYTLEFDVDLRICGYFQNCLRMFKNFKLSSINSIEDQKPKLNKFS